MRTWKTIALGFALYTQSFAYAGNEHEHLQYLPSYADIQQASHGQLGRIPAQYIFGQNPMVLQEIFGEKTLTQILSGKTYPNLKAGLQDLIQQSSFEELCQKIALARASSSQRMTAGQLMRFFFDDTGDFGFSKLDRYQISGVARTELFNKDPNLLVRAVENHLKVAPRSSTLKTIFSVPGQLAEENTLKKIQSLYASRGAQAQFFISIPRKSFTEKKPLSNVKRTRLEEGLKNRWIQGVDFSGSLLEGVYEKGFDPELASSYKKNIKEIFNLVRSSGSSARIHAFEEVNRGTFYSSLWEAIESCRAEGCLPAQMRIGHIQALKDADIERLSTIKNSKIIFEANIESNLRIQKDAELEKLARTIEKIHAKNMRVVIGADGLGILGDSANFENTLIKLKSANLSEKSLERLMRDAHLSISGSRISKTQLLEWQRERAEIRKRVLGLDVKPLYRGPCRIDQALWRLVGGAQK